jgi:hypothetical protein
VARCRTHTLKMSRTNFHEGVVAHVAWEKTTSAGSKIREWEIRRCTKNYITSTKAWPLLDLALTLGPGHFWTWPSRFHSRGSTCWHVAFWHLAFELVRVPFFDDGMVHPVVGPADDPIRMPLVERSGVGGCRPTLARLPPLHLRLLPLRVLCSRRRLRHRARHRRRGRLCRHLP